MHRGIRATADGFRRRRARAGRVEDADGAVEGVPTRVLLAEDDDEMRRMLAELLRRDGYLVTEARDGQQLTDRICRVLFGDDGTAPDILVSDIRMPGRSGLDVLSLVRGADAGLPIILITAFGDADTHRRAEQLGADAVFDKPLDLDELRAAVHRHAPPV